MKEEMKGLFKWSLLLVAGAVISLVGAFMGKTLLGWVLFGVGLAVVVGITVLLFLKKRFFASPRWMNLAAGLLIGAFAAASVLIIAAASNTTRARTTSGSLTSLLGLGGGGTNYYRSQFSGGGNFSGFNGGGQFTRNNSGTGGTTANQGTTTTNRGSTSNFSQGNSNFQGQFNGTGTTNSSGTNGNFSTGTSSYSAANRFVSQRIPAVWGWVLLGLGAAVLLAAVILLATKKISLKDGGGRVTILGLVLGILMAFSVTTMLNSRNLSSLRNSTAFQARISAMATAQAEGTPMSQFGGSNGTASQSVGNTNTNANTTPTPAATDALTATPTDEPTITPTPTVQAVSSIFVCLNQNAPDGYSMRVAPSPSASFGGSIQWGSCFYVDGRAQGVDGWYHVMKGQQGTVGLSFWVDQNTQPLWVQGTYLESFNSDLNALPEIPVTQ